MRKREYYWSLYHTPERNQIDNLRTDQVEAVFACLPLKVRSEWWIWRDGFQNWKPFSHFPQLLVSLRKVEAQVVDQAPAPPSQVDITNANEIDVDMEGQIDNVSEDSVPVPLGLALGSKVPEPKPKTYEPKKIVESSGVVSPDLSLMQDNVEDRSNNRFDRVIDAKIIVGDKAFTNQTANISLKGIQFKLPLPPNLPRYFNVEIRFQDKVIPLVCTEIKNKDGKPSNRARIEVNDYASALLAMLLAG